MAKLSLNPKQLAVLGAGVGACLYLPLMLPDMHRDIVSPSASLPSATFPASEVGGVTAVAGHVAVRMPMPNARGLLLVSLPSALLAAGVVWALRSKS